MENFEAKQAYTLALEKTGCSVANHQKAWWGAVFEQNLLAMEHFWAIEGLHLFDWKEPKSGKSILEYAMYYHRHDALAAILSWVEPVARSSTEPLALEVDVFEPVRSHCQECLGLLLQSGFARLEGENAKGVTPLVAAANLVHEKHSTKILPMLLQAGANVNAVTSKGYFALGASASFNKSADIEILVAHDAQVNLSAGDGFSALFYAIDNKATAAAEALLRAGADFNATTVIDDQSLTPLGYAKYTMDAPMAALLFAFEEASKLRERLGFEHPGALRALGKKAARL